MIKFKNKDAKDAKDTKDTMNLSEHLCVDKELFSGTNVKENTKDTNIFIEN